MAFAVVAMAHPISGNTVFTEPIHSCNGNAAFGAQIKVSGDEAIITGNRPLAGASVMMSDIRAGAGLVLAH